MRPAWTRFTCACLESRARIGVCTARPPTRPAFLTGRGGRLLPCAALFFRRVPKSSAREPFQDDVRVRSPELLKGRHQFGAVACTERGRLPIDEDGPVRVSGRHGAIVVPTASGRRHARRYLRVSRRLCTANARMPSSRLRAARRPRSDGVCEDLPRRQRRHARLHRDEARWRFRQAGNGSIRLDCAATDTSQRECSVSGLKKYRKIVRDDGQCSLGGVRKSARCADPWTPRSRGATGRPTVPAVSASRRASSV